MNRDVLKLTREKLRRELEKAPRVEVAEVNHDHFIREVQIREADYTYEKIEGHFRDNPIQIREIKVTYVRELPKKTIDQKER